MANESEAPKEFYSTEFKDWADAVLEEINITQADITPHCCKQVYLHLVDYIND